MKRIRISLQTLIVATVFAACTKENPVPMVAVDIAKMNVEADPQMSALLAPYNAVTVSGGYKMNGILIYRVKKEYAVDDFVAYDRTCPYESDTSIMVWSKKSPMVCKCRRCGTTFNLVGGYLESGPSKFPPRRYNCQFIDGNLYIHN